MANDAFPDAALLDQLPARIAYWGADRRCRFVNRAYCEFFRRSREEMIGRSMEEVFGPAYGTIDQTKVAAAFRGEPQVFEREMRGPHGEPRHVQVTYTPDIVDGEVRGFSVLGVDLTDRRKAEVDLADRERQLREVQRIAGLGHWTWDLIANTSTWSEQMFAIYGRDPALGAPTYEELAAYYSPEDNAQLRELVQHALATGEPYRTSKCIRRRDGSRAWVETVNEAVRDTSGRVTQLRGTVLDISARKEAELALNEAQRIAGVGSWQWNVLDGTLTWSDEMFRIYARDRCLGAPTLEELARYSPATHSPSADLARRTLATGEPHNFESVIVRDDGTTVWTLSHLEAMRNDQGAIVGLRGTSQNITARKQAELARERSEADLREAQRIAGVGSWTWDAVTGAMTWSDEMFRIYDRDLARGAPRAEDAVDYYGDAGHEVMTSLATACATGAPFSHEGVIRRRDGSQTWCLAHGEPVTDPTGAIVGVRGTVADITARKRTELALAQSEAALREAQRIASVGSWTWDVATDTATWSPEMYRIYDRDPSVPLPGIEEMAEHHTPESHLALTTAVRHAIATGEPYTQECVLRRPDGSHRWVACRGEIVADDRGTIYALRGTVTDVTTRKQAELALARSEATLREAQRIASVGSWHWDVATETSTWSDEMFRIFGLDPVLGPPSFEEIATWYTPADYAQLIDAVGRAIATGEPYTAEQAVTRPDGKRIWVKRIGEPVRDADGAVVAIRGTTLDITARKETELALERSEAALRTAQRIANVGSWQWTIGAPGATWSEQMFPIYGRDPALGPPTFAELARWHSTADHALFQADLKRCLETGQTCMHEVPITCPDGRVAWIRRVAERTTDANGTPTGVRGTTLDITEQKQSELAVTRSVAALREAQRIARVGSWELDLHSHTTTWSDETYRIFGRDPALGPPTFAELAGYYPRAEYARVQADIAHALETGESYSGEAQIHRPDGTTVWIRRTGEAVRDASGTIVRMRGTTADITDHKQTELALAAREEELREAQRIAHVGSWRWDRSTREYVWSDELYRIYGLDPAQGPLTLDQKRAFYKAEDYATYMAQLVRTEQTGEPFSHELPLTRPDGSVLWVHRVGEAVRNEHGAITGVRGTTLDITARKKSELALARSEEDLHEAQRIASVGSWALDVRTVTFTWSPEMFRIFGRDPELGPPGFEELGRWYAPTELALVREDFARAIATGERYSREQPITRPDGSVAWIRRVGEAIRDADGAVIALRGTTHDITDRKQAELALHRAAVDLHEAQRIAHVGSWYWEIGTTRAVWSEEMFRIFGLDPAEGAPTLDGLARMYSATDYALFRADTQRAAETGEPYKHEMSFTRPDGRIVWIKRIGEPVRDADGKIVALRGTTLDITERKQTELSLARSEEDLLQAQRIAHVGSFYWDARTGASDWSEEMYRIFGRDPALGPPTIEELEASFTSDDYTVFRAQVERALTTGDPYSHEFPAIRPDGKLVWIKRTGEPVRDDDGTIIAVRGTALDITERKLTELALARSEARLVEAQRIAGVGSWEWDVASRRCTWSDEMFRIYGIDPARGALSSDELAAFFTAEAHARYEADVARAVSTGEGFSHELPLQRPDGSCVWVKRVAEAIRDEQGVVRMLRGTTLDITDRKHTELALARSEAALRQAQRIAKVGSWHWDVATGVSTWSEELFRMYGLEPRPYAPSLDEMRPYYAPEYYAQLRDDIARAVETGESYSHELELVRPDGRKIWVRRVGEVVRDERGAITAVRGTTLDITERKEAELAVARTQRALIEAQRIAHVGSWEFDRTTHKVTWSDEMYRIYDRDPALGPPTVHELAEYLTPATFAQLRRNHEHTLQTGDGTTTELSIRHRDGSIVWALGRAELHRDSNGAVLGLRGTATDITARKQAELALKASEKNLREAQRIAGVGSWELDTRTGAITWSDEVFRIYGRDPALGPPPLSELAAVYSDEAYRTLMDDLERVIATGRAYTHEVPLKRADGTTRWVQRTGEAIHDDAGAVIGVRGTTMDITQRKEAELAVKASEAKLLEAQRIAGVGSWDWILATGVTTWSNEVYRIYQRDPALGPPNFNELASMCTPATFEQIKNDLEQIVATGRPYSHEVELHLPGDRTVWVKRSGEPMYDVTGAIIGARGTTMDITERKQAELALQDSEAALRDAQRIARLGSWRLDRASGKTQWSDQVFQIFGRDPTLGPPAISELPRYYDAAELPELQRDVALAMAGGSYLRERCVKRDDGEQAWILIRGEPQHDAQGAIIGVHGTTMDITQRKLAELALVASEATLREAQRIAGLGSWRWIAATGKSTWSDETFRIFGRDPALGEPDLKGISAYYGQDSVDELRRALDRLVRTGTPYETESRVRRDDGTYRWVARRAIPLRNASGEIIGAQGTAMDITERKQADLAQRANELALREAQRIARMGSWDWDVATGVIAWSDAARGVLGWSPDAPVPSFEDQQPLFTAESWAVLQEVVAAAMTEGRSFDIEVELVPRPGLQTRWLRSRCEVVCDGSKVLGLHGILMDITDQHTADAALRDSEARYALIARNTQDVIWLYDLEDERFEYISPAIRSLLGLDLDDPIDLAIGDLLPPAILTSVLARRDSGPAPMVETRMHRADGTDVPVEISLMLVRGDGDRITHLQGVTRDVSSRKQLEQQVLQLQKMESVGRLAGGIAHDFNNLLTVIMGQLEFVLEELPHDSEHAEALRDATTAATRSAELTRQLLAFARQQKILPRVLDINDEIDRGTTMLRRLVGEHIDLVWTPSASSWPVKLDPTQIHQLLANMIVNARDAISGHGSIRISTSNDVFDEVFCAAHPGSRPGSYVQLAVTDTGCGMSPEVRARVFEPFFTTKDPARGTGLGLSIVYGIVTQNHGYITVDSTPGAGTTFRLWFPRSEGDATRTRTTGDVPRGNETLLVVEDERAVLALTRDMLKRLGYRVLTANSPAEALSTFAAQGATVDLVLTDVVMPQMNGRELTEKLHELRPDVPCLYMSGYTADAALGGEIDVERLLQKPFTLPELARAVRQVLAHRAITA